MKKTIKLLALTLTVGVSLSAARPTVAAAASSAALQAGDLIAICGDSITEQKSYSIYLEDYFLMCQPAGNLQAVQLGLGGEGAPSFATRLQADALPYHPTVATIFYGMNDGGYTAPDEALKKRFRDGMAAVVRTFKDAGLRLIVAGTPGVVDSDAFKRPGTAPEVYNETLRQLGEMSKEVADSEGVVFADVHSLLLDMMAKAKAKYGAAYHVAGADGVHPDWNGHLVIAYAFLKALGCDGNIGAITYDFGAGQATADRAQKILSVTNGEIQVESTRYPFCFFGNPDATRSTRGMLEFLPFNEDLNRYTLTVTNARGDLKVTWGKESKVFPAAALAKGVNLAAEFLDNPFAAKFIEVEKAIRSQQNIETPIIRTSSLLALIVRELPDTQAEFDQLRQTMFGLDAKLRQRAADSVTPVTHTIKIEPVN
ncbi:MAG: SGNH/GDSL hydrolase family protein [Verrucomicrobiales bacterium]|jgi:lysophospholipase L1-like esterase|nr:SGNH/GDSL hydrolase family protein [Verrucomicrobiales bacterium]